MPNDNSSLLLDLMKGTDFEIMTDSKILSNRMKVKTPLEAVNCLLGGGFPVGIIAHFYGAPRAGKSTILYQTMGNFQRQYPEGISIIIDMESSADPNRLTALGVDVQKVVRLPATSIESGFKALMQLISNKEDTDALKNVPMFVIWDTISKGLATDSTIQSRMAAMDRARVIKGYMSELQKSIEKHDFFLGLLNQVIYTTDKYGNRKVSAGGGVALQHDNQISFLVDLDSDNFDDYGMLRTRVGRASIDKSKLSPEVRNLPYVMDVTSGAKISERSSFFLYMIWLGILNQASKGWYSMRPTFDHQAADELTKQVLSKVCDIDKKMRWADFEEYIVSNDIIHNLLRHLYMTLIESNYKLQSEIMKDYHNECLDSLKSDLLNLGLMKEAEFDKYAYGVINEINEETTDQEDINDVDREHEDLQETSDN